MKNRTVIGIICMVLAVATTFLIAPLVTKLTADTVSVPRLCENVTRGAKIDESCVEVVSVKSDTLPSGVITDTKNIIGLYATTNLFSGDYLTSAKLSLNSNTADDAFSSLKGDKYAMSFTIDSFAAGLSGKIQNGDIISLVTVDKNSGKSTMPAEFKYVKVITTTTAGGVDQDKVVPNEDGSYTPPSTVTLLVNATQAKLLAEYEEGTINCVLVYRGNAENAQKFLDKQDEYFEKASGKAESKADETNKTNNENESETKTANDDVVERANDIINGNADYYDVNEAVNDNG